jgi:hypothetical protein
MAERVAPGVPAGGEFKSQSREDGHVTLSDVRMVPLAVQWRETDTDEGALARNEVHDRLVSNGFNIVGQNWSDDNGHELSVVGVEPDADDEGAVIGFVVLHQPDLSGSDPMRDVSPERIEDAKMSMATWAEADGWRAGTEVRFISVVGAGTSQVDVRMTGNL